MKWNFIYILFISLPLANIIHESGELSEFLGGHSPGSSYDNWVSHVTEGIASDGFNDYGPDWLDVQTTGFGNYNKLELISGRITSNNIKSGVLLSTAFNAFVPS